MPLDMLPLAAQRELRYYVQRPQYPSHASF